MAARTTASDCLPSPSNLEHCRALGIVDMAYYLNAVLGNTKLLQTAALAMPPAVFVPLTGELGLIPLPEDLIDAINQGNTETYEKGEPQTFTCLSRMVASWLQTLSTGTILAYVEAEYFGGDGDQGAVAWKDGIEVLPPTKAQDAINQALRLLGVRPAGDKDEFDTVWLGRHRTMGGWVDEGTARQRMILEPTRRFTYPTFDEAVESFRRFLVDQGFSDTIRWICARTSAPVALLALGGRGIERSSSISQARPRHRSWSVTTTTVLVAISEWPWRSSALRQALLAASCTFLKTKQTPRTACWRGCT